jgi:hypothetical protein
VDAARSADEAWSVVSTLTPAQVRKERKQADVSDADALSEVDLYVEASRSAEKFSARFRNDPRVGEARKMEVIFALQAGHLGAASYKQTAAALGSAYRANKSNPAKDRFDVAFLMEGVALAETLAGRRFLDDGAKYEQFVDRLHTEFGGTAEVHGLYTSIVRTTDVRTATRVANKLLGMKQAPVWARQPAQAALDRSKLIGKPLQIKLATIGGGTIDLRAPASVPTVVFLWSVTDGLSASLGLAEKFKQSTAVDARWLYVGLGGDAPVSDRSMAGTVFAASHCFVRPQFGNEITNYLRVDQAPYAFVINRAGALVGYGFPENIPALLEAANR